MRICRDLRHQRVRLLQFASADARQFGNWSMVQATPTRKLERIAPALDFGDSRRMDAVSAGAAIELMRSLLLAGATLKRDRDVAEGRRTLRRCYPALEEAGPSQRMRTIPFMSRGNNRRCCSLRQEPYRNCGRPVARAGVLCGRCKSSGRGWGCAFSPSRNVAGVELADRTNGSCEPHPTVQKKDQGIMGLDRRVIWILTVVLLVVVLWWALDHVLFPTLPMPAGAPPITK